MFRRFVCLPLAASLLVACAGEPSTDNDAEDPVTGAAAITLSASAEPLKSFGYDTGLIPAGSPAQVQLKLSAGGAIRVEAGGTPSEKGLAGKKGSGKVSVDLHVKLDGRLKQSALGDSDGDLPGLKDIDIAIQGETAFDPFLVGAKEQAGLDVKIPAADLPEIPLGTTPGKLRLHIVEGSVLHSSFHGACVAVAKEKATFDGELETSGTVILKGTLAVETLGFAKEVDLGNIEVPIPALKTTLNFAPKAAKGAKDGADGAVCGGAASKADAPANATSDTAAPSASAPAGTTASGAPLPDDDHANGEPSGAPNACTDDREPNNTYDTASDFGAIDSNASSNRHFTVAAQTVDATDSDWYKFRIVDKNWITNPQVTAETTDKTLEVSVFYLCDNHRTYSTCAATDAETGEFVGGCTNTGLNTVLYTDCTGSDESGTAYVRVRRPSTTNVCRGYDLAIAID